MDKKSMAGVLDRGTTGGCEGYDTFYPRETPTRVVFWGIQRIMVIGNGPPDPALGAVPFNLTLRHLFPCAFFHSRHRTVLIFPNPPNTP